MQTIYRVGYWLESHYLIEHAINLVAGYPRPTHPAMIDRKWFGDDKAQVIRYLKTGHKHLPYMGYSWCRFKCGIDSKKMGSYDLTDGTWYWPEGLSHYIEQHDVILPEIFIEHMHANCFEVPERPDWLDWSSERLAQKCHFDNSTWTEWYHRRLTS